MSKLKVSFKNAQVSVKSKLEKSEEINHREVEIFQTKLIRGLIRPAPMGKNKLIYTAPCQMDLKKYLKSGISKNDFFLVFAQIIEVTKKVEHNGFNINNLVLNLQYSFINEKTKEVYFIYQPVLSQNISANIFSYLYDMAFACVFQLNEDVRFLNELVDFLRHMQFYSTTEIENYILSIYPEVYRQVQRQKPGQSQLLNDRKYASSACYAPAGEEGTTLLGDEEEGTSLLEEEGTSLLDEEGTSLLEEEGTTLLEEETRPAAYLTRMKTYERVDLDKPLFRLGKEKSYVDYCITDNNAVSRLHADVITQGTSYYIRDNNSTNKTFVNGRVIAVNQDTEIFKGDRIMLANEEFEFHID